MFPAGLPHSEIRKIGCSAATSRHQWLPRPPRPGRRLERAAATFRGRFPYACAVANQQIDFNNPDAAVQLLDQAADCLHDSPFRHGSAERLPASGMLLATGDLHDNSEHLARLVQLAKINKSSDNHLILQEMIHGERLINGMDFSYRMLLRVAQLIVDHPGQVHPVLANHELSQMTDVHISKGGADHIELFDAALEHVFGESWMDVVDAINRLIRAMPLAVLSEHGVCCAHSLPNSRQMKYFDMDVFDRELEEDDYHGPHGAAYLMVWGRRYSKAQVDRLAEAWDVELFCLGHQYTEVGIEQQGPRVVILNCDLERAAALPIDLAEIPTSEEAVLNAVPLQAVSVES